MTGAHLGHLDNMLGLNVWDKKFWRKCDKKINIYWEIYHQAPYWTSGRKIPNKITGTHLHVGLLV